MKEPDVNIGPTSIIGWLTALAGMLPVIIKTIETGSSALEQLNGPEEVAALIGIVAFVITQLGRYVQSVTFLRGVFTRGAPGPQGPPGPPGPTGK
jgi:hypothetical protein